VAGGDPWDSALKKFDAQTAHNILITVHDAWSNGALERMLSHYTDDVIYWCNAGHVQGQPFQMDGKQGMRTFLHTILAVAESGTSVVDFSFDDGLAHATIKAHIKHRRTGHEIRGSYRQIVTFRGRKICRVDEFHDTERMSQFWHMVSVDGEMPPPEAQ
jgi:ketosteroid isomerase-like protein